METPQDSSTKFTWARAFRDIGVHAINTGQFPFFCMFVISLVVLFRVDPLTLDTIFLGFFKNLTQYIWTGYSLLLITIVGVTFYIKAMNKRHKDQITARDNVIGSLKEDLKALNSPKMGETQ